MTQTDPLTSIDKENVPLLETFKTIAPIYHQIENKEIEKYINSPNWLLKYLSIKKLNESNKEHDLNKIFEISMHSEPPFFETCLQIFHQRSKTDAAWLISKLAHKNVDHRNHAQLLIRFIYKKKPSELLKYISQSGYITACKIINICFETHQEKIIPFLEEAILHPYTGKLAILHIASYKKSSYIKTFIHCYNKPEYRTHIIYACTLIGKEKSILELKRLQKDPQFNKNATEILDRLTK